MKALRIILIIVGVLLAIVLIVPLFSPATAEVSAETEIALEPSRLFPGIAKFSDREIWDPWVTQDSTAEVTVESKDAFVHYLDYEESGPCRFYSCLPIKLNLNPKKEKS